MVRPQIARTVKTSMLALLWGIVCYSFLALLLKRAHVPLRGAVPLAIASTFILWMSSTPVYQEVRRIWTEIGSQLRSLGTPTQFSALRLGGNKTRESRLIVRPPGMGLFKIADFLFSEKTVALTFSPLLGEWHSEYFRALRKGRTAKAQWICVRYRWAFLKAMLLSRIYEIIKFIRK